MAKIQAESDAAWRQFERHKVFIERANGFAASVENMTTTYGPYSLMRCGDDAFLTTTTGLDDAVTWWCDSEQEGFREDSWPSTQGEVFEAIWRVTDVIWSSDDRDLHADSLIADLRTSLSESDAREICAALRIPT